LDVTELYVSPVGFGGDAGAEVLRKNGFASAHIAG
jgi:hypothetical protein